MSPTEHPLCPTCGQPATEGLADHTGLWECENEACPEFGQVVQVDGGGPGSPGGEL